MNASMHAVPRRLPAVEGIWVFVAADLCFFLLLFVSFMVERGKAPALFEASRQTLNVDIGGINTLILLASSWFVVKAVGAAKRDGFDAIPRWLLAAIACGIAFWVSKVIEYGAKLGDGITLTSNPFFTFYYALTGIHLLHVTAGTVVLAVLWSQSRRRVHQAGHLAWIEGGATFWHMVDLLWILLFPLLYLLR